MQGVSIFSPTMCASRPYLQYMCVIYVCDYMYVCTYVCICMYVISACIFNAYVRTVLELGTWVRQTLVRCSTSCGTNLLTSTAQSEHQFSRDIRLG